ncbi:hypothetical protein FF38_10112 [Lucilia cuprina]|uniref:Uncharacterized protein n=1 Tax=Lucilia cuprina TaxID=7375 RepID=A0A0L0CRX5_LUCCU|nr:hypothetical protein FF38_10112 [Lucilia cuprina]
MTMGAMLRPEHRQQLAAIKPLTLINRKLNLEPTKEKFTYSFEIEESSPKKTHTTTKTVLTSIKESRQKRHGNSYDSSNSAIPQKGNMMQGSAFGRRFCGTIVLFKASNSYVHPSIDTGLVGNFKTPMALSICERIAIYAINKAEVMQPTFSLNL